MNKEINESRYNLELEKKLKESYSVKKLSINLEDSPIKSKK